MPAVLTLHHGDARETFTEHPIEVARKALLAAADLEETSRWAGVLRQMANALPERGPVTR